MDAELGTMGEEVSNNCIVCYEDFTETGDHKPVAIACGHLFGEKCIRHWWTINKTCPICKKRFKRTSIRPIYAQKVVVADEEVRNLKGQIESKNDEIERWKEENRNIQRGKRQAEMLNRELTEENKRLRMSLASVDSELSLRRSAVSEPGDMFVRMTEAIPVQNSTCFAMTKGLVCLMVEQNSHQLRQVQVQGRIVNGATDFRDQGSGCVWDISISKDDSKASVAAGNQLHVVTNLDQIGKAQLQGCLTNDGQQILSCAWDDGNQKVYCGLGDGRVQVFDIRNNACVSELSHPTKHGIFSLASSGGRIYGCTRREVLVWDNDVSEIPWCLREVPGSIEGLAVEEELLAVSVRPRNELGVAFHEIYDSDSMVGSLTGHKSFSTKTKGSFIITPHSPMFASGDEMNNSWCCWDIHSGNMIQRGMGAFGNPRQICSQNVDASSFVGVLDSNSLSMFRYRGLQE
ncbi:hypothetical protein BSKO_11493 [Bryopsis sp. KO-2023]|nr:hypothetical protein BSKO_11493 [Bryopsis sp. KO-2023]